MMETMHLTPPDRAHRHAIDGHTVCDAIEGIGDLERVQTWAQLFTLLSDPGRLAILLAVRSAGPIAVSDIALATGISDTAVSQALRLLRTSGTIRAIKKGRIVRYQLCDDNVTELLDSVAPSTPAQASS